MSAKGTAPPVQPARRQPESLRIRAVSAALTVSDIQRSLVFYHDVLGFTVDETWEVGERLAGVGLKAGSARLVLVQDDQIRDPGAAKGIGIRLYFTTAQDIDAVAAGIKARGGVLASEPTDQPWGVRTLTLKDPDGFGVVISPAE